MPRTELTTSLETAGLLYRQAMRLTQRLRTSRSGEGLGLSKSGILFRLRQVGPSTATDLAAHLGLQPQSLTRLLASLERDGFILRTPSSVDRRQSDIELTDAGRSLLARDFEKRRIHLAEAMNRTLTSSEQEILRIAAGLMDRLAGAIDVSDTSIETTTEGIPPANSERKFMEPTINSITLGVSDLGRAIRFYRDGLGLSTKAEDGVHIAFFETTGTRLTLYPLERLAEYAGAEWRPNNGQFSGITLTHAVRTKAEVSGVLALAEKAGAKIVKSAHDVFWGGHAGFFTDLDGYFWEVAWAPKR